MKRNGHVSDCGGFLAGSAPGAFVQTDDGLGMFLIASDHPGCIFYVSLPNGQNLTDVVSSHFTRGAKSVSSTDNVPSDLYLF